MYDNSFNVCNSRADVFRPGSLHSSRRDIDFMVMVVDRFESKPFNRRSYPWSGLTKQA